MAWTSSFGAFARAFAARALAMRSPAYVGGAAATTLGLSLTPYGAAACDAAPAKVAPPPRDSKAALRALSTFKGEVAIVTGAATGIGRSVAELLVEAGAKVYAIDVQKFTIPGAAATLQCDVSNVDQLTTTLHGIVDKEGGRVDHLICCAGVWTYGELSETPEKEFDRVVGINVKGTFYSMAAVLPAMVKRGAGSIVVIGSDQSFVGKPGQNLYGLTKGAVGQLVKSTAAQYAPNGVRVNAVCPGSIDTPLLRGAVAKIASLKPDGPSTDDLLEWLQTAQPLPRMGDTVEIALAVALVAKVPFMTGSLVAVDGGYTCQ